MARHLSIRLRIGCQTPRIGPVEATPFTNQVRAAEEVQLDDHVTSATRCVRDGSERARTAERTPLATHRRHRGRIAPLLLSRRRILAAEPPHKTLPGIGELGDGFVPT